MKKLLILLLTIPVLLASYTASAALSTAGWFYKVNYTTEDGVRRYALRGAYSTEFDCNRARGNHIDDYYFLELSYSCTLFYSDEYDAIEDTQDLWGISPTIWISLSNDQKDLLIEKIKVIKPAYNIQGFREEIQQALNDVVKSSQ